MLTSFTDLMRNSYDGLSKDVWMLALITLINRTGSMVIVFLTLYLTTELDFTYTQAGIAMSCYGIGSVAGSYIGGWLTDRVGYYPTMFWSLLIGGFSFFGLMQITSFIGFCIGVLMVSTIVDTFRPASMASIGTYSKPENHNRSLSLIRLAINLGFAAGAAATGFISVYFGYDWLFAIDGLTCITAAFALRVVLKEKKVATKKEEPVKKVAPSESRSAYRDKNFLYFIAIKGLAAIAFMQLFSAFPVFVKEELLFSEDQFGLLMLINGLLIVVLEMPMVYLLEKRFQRLPLVIFGYGLFALGYFVLTISGFWIATLVFFILAISLGEIIGFPFSNAFALSRSGEDRRGEFMGLYSMAFSIAFIIAPIVGMYVAEEYGFKMLWTLCGGISTLSVCLFFVVKGRIDKEDRLAKEEVLREAVVV